MALGLSDEQRLVVACVRHAFGQNGAARFDQLLDWELASRFALQQGVGPLVHAGLEGASLPAPESFQARVRDGYLATWLHRKLFIWPTFRRVLEALQAAGLEPIVLKGAALAHAVY